MFGVPTLRGSQELAAVLAAVAVGGGFDVSKTCSRLVSVSSSLDGVIEGSESYAGVATGVISAADSATGSEIGSSTIGTGSGAAIDSAGLISSMCLELC